VGVIAGLVATSLPLAQRLLPWPSNPLAANHSIQELQTMKTTPRLPFARAAVLTFGITWAALSAHAADGKGTYDKVCAVCHATGVANAPKYGDKAAWAPRAATGKEALMSSVVKGKGAMPPKAGSGDLKDDDIKAAIDFMLAAAK